MRELIVQTGKVSEGVLSVFSEYGSSFPVSSNNCTELLVISEWMND